MTARLRTSCAGRGGFTLLETMFSLLIMGGMVVAAMGTFGTLVKSRQTNKSRAMATALAGQYMAEILQCCYTDPNGGSGLGLEAGEPNANRAAFDDIDDYNNFADSPPKQKDGTAIAGLNGWTRTATVTYIDPNTLAVIATDQGLKCITVTVTDPMGVKTSITALRSSTGTYDQKPTQETNAVRWVGLEFQIGSDGNARMFCGTDVPNIVPG